MSKLDQTRLYSIKSNHGEKMEYNRTLDKIIFYNMALLFPFFALVTVLVLEFGKPKNQLLERIKLISLYEMLDFGVVLFAYYVNGVDGVKFSVIILLVFYVLLNGIAAYRKNDYVSRGICLGLFTNHYSLAIFQTSGNSTARVDGSKYPDCGLAMFLMVNKVLCVLLTYFFICEILPTVLARITSGSVFKSISLDVLPALSF
jgi:hypothetical protein